ncbi:dihydrodipicolinate synthase family protein [Abiotrophia sp. HMSC24B09]|uniref:dihydrodipicolinate synthase family protein n=1 Tax=Abiotrophia sp. HMSC24B09 TaxID=1581061 RepID=UPI0008A64361|nr:dihydrodipicolinate synthase family protein [Abiotrophia sp. HMSC24B09]OFS29882.1 N-acetylneuraminate lyase [Abiotrophia sp. HMSC24B09]
MSKFDKYKGIIPAFYACYDDEGNISPERTQALAKHYLEVGVKGLYVGGSSGECIYQNIEERKLVLEHVMKAVGGKMTIIAHVAAASTRDSVELAKHAESLGVDALAAIPPIYFRLPEHSIKDYWNAMIDATELDFIIYNIPQLSGYALTPSMFKSMLENPKVIGVKNSSMPVQDLITWKLTAGDREVVVFNGPDEQFIGGRVMGADGGIGGTYGVMPELFLAANAALEAGDLALAFTIQGRIDEIIFTLVSGKANLYAVQKEILKREGLNCGSVRPPLTGVGPEDLAVVDKAHAMIQAARAEFVK